MTHPFLPAWMLRALTSRGASVLLSLSATLAVLGSLAWLGWTGISLRTEMRVEAARAVQVAEVRGEITDSNDRLAMSARLAAASGEARWMDYYNEERPRLSDALSRAAALADRRIAAELTDTLDEAARNLDMMERAAMARSASGDRTGALSLLDGPECGFLQASYTSGVDAFNQELAQLARTRTDQLDRRVWRELFGLTSLAVLLVTVALVLLAQARLRLAFVRAERAARTDALTGLGNRFHLLETLHQTLRAPAHADKDVALLLLDLDQFKTVNDLHGYAAGDNLLRLVGKRLKGVIPATDFIARLGGDEFIVALRMVSAPGLPSRDTAAQVATRVSHALGEPFKLDNGVQISVGVSIGLAFAVGLETAEAFVRRAEIALHRTKIRQPGGFQFFEPGMDAVTLMHATLVSDLRDAVHADLIVPHFQPLVELGTGRIIGFEMLARWIDPVRGAVPPSDFIPIAEELGLIGKMTECLLRRACRAAASWPADISLACNISPQQLQDDGLVRMIRRVLDEVRFPPHRLELEVTENALVGDLATANDILRELKALGIRLALDDFGTGYSSLRHLQTLPFDTLKIDASFVSAMADDKESHKIVSAVIGLGRSLDLRIVAEGVETPETFVLLHALDCDVGQGWLFGRPCSAADAEALLLEPVAS